MKKILLFCTIIYSMMLSAQNKENIISIASKKVVLEGTLTYTAESKKLVILIAGSGPTDRDGNNIAGVNSDCYKQLAQALQKEHIACYRYDKRAIGKSVVPNFKEEQLSFEDYINDAVTIYHYAKDSLHFPQIYFAGHSEGSLIGMIAAQKTNATGYISISGAAQSIDQLVQQQVAEQPEEVQEKVKEIFEELKKGNEVDQVPQYLFSLFRPSVQPYMISWLKYQPTAEITKLSMPILIINGTCDVQVKQDQAKLLAAAKPSAQLVIIPKMTHVLKDATDDNCTNGMKTYKDPLLPINSILVQTLVQFVNSHS